MISEQWAQLLEPGLRAIFEEQRTALAAVAKAPMFFGTAPSTKAQEHFLSTGGMGDWTEYKGAIEYDEFDQLYKTSFTHTEYVRGFQVERKLVEDDQYNIINTRPRMLALGAMRTREKHAASVFNNAFSGSYLGGDSKALCASDHPLSPNRGGSQGNAGSTALSYDAIIATRILMRAYKDDRGELIPIAPDTLLVPPALEQTAVEIVKTLNNKPNTADNVVNFVSGFLRNVVVWDYLTDSNNWFLIDSAMAKMQLLWLDRVNLEFALNPLSDYQLTAQYRGYMRYSYGWTDWRWLYGHAV
jgi:phage major head subunit gpT-like protein